MAIEKRPAFLSGSPMAPNEKKPSPTRWLRLDMAVPSQMESEPWFSTDWIGRTRNCFVVDTVYLWFTGVVKYLSQLQVYRTFLEAVSFFFFQMHTSTSILFEVTLLVLHLCWCQIVDMAQNYPKELVVSYPQNHIFFVSLSTSLTWSQVWYHPKFDVYLNSPS